MTTVIHIPAQLDVPIVCDMSAASDTPDERLAEWARLFERSLLRRERRPDALVFVFGADSGTRETAEELARREAACCPFLDYRVETIGDEVIWTVTNAITGDQRESVDAMLDAVHDLPEHAGSDMDRLLGRLADRDVHIIEAGGGRFELDDRRASR
jgi:hypothetical protein